MKPIKVLSGSLILFTIACIPGTAIGGPSPDRGELRATLQDLWSSLESLEFTSSEYACDDTLTRLPHATLLQYTFRYAKGGRYSVKGIAREVTGAEDTIANVVEDGRYRWDLQTFRDDGKTLNGIKKAYSESSDQRYTGPACIALLLLLPKGRPLHTYLGDESQIQYRVDEGQRRTVRIFADARTREPCTIDLDPEKDYLPLRISYADGKTVVTVSRFGIDNGRYFPIEGTEVSRVRTAGRPVFFNVANLAINRLVRASAFEAPKVADGVIVRDEILRKKYLKGTTASRERLLRAHRDARKRAGKKDAPPLAIAEDPVTAPAEPKRLPLGLALSIGSGVVLAIAALMWLRRRVPS